MSDYSWPSGLPVVAIRMARQTDQLDALVRFYRDGLGLKVITSFQDHAGLDGVIIGLPDESCQLEFVHHETGSPGVSPNHENLLVFYVSNEQDVAQKAGHLLTMGYNRVPSAKPWWDEHGAITIEDPDGWRIVFQPER